MTDDMVARIRAFNRYYTVWLDVMSKGYLETELTWPEARVIYEIYLYPGISATDLCAHLNMDKSYVSRILGKYENRGLLTRRSVLGHRGLKAIWLTEKGRSEAEKIDQNGNTQIVEKLERMDDRTGQKLCEAMTFIEKTLRQYDRKEV